MIPQTFPSLKSRWPQPHHHAPPAGLPAFLGLAAGLPALVQCLAGLPAPHLARLPAIWLSLPSSGHSTLHTTWLSFFLIFLVFSMCFCFFSFLHFDVVFVFRACGFEGPGPSESVASSFAASVVLVSISVELALEGSATLLSTLSTCVKPGPRSCS